MVTYDEIKHNEAIKTYIKKADEALNALGYTEHSLAHVGKVAETAGYILGETGATDRELQNQPCQLGQGRREDYLLQLHARA